MGVKIEKKPVTPPADDEPPFAMTDTGEQIAIDPEGDDPGEEPTSPPAGDDEPKITIPKPVKKGEKKTVTVKKPDPKPVDNPVDETPEVAVAAEPEAVQKVQPIATIETQHKTGAVTTEVEKVGEPLIVKAAQPMANVGYSAGMTKNLGDYNNVKFQVSLHMPCLPEPDKIDEAFAFVETWVDGRLEKLVAGLED